MKMKLKNFLRGFLSVFSIAPRFNHPDDVKKEMEAMRKQWFGNPIHPIKDGKFIGIYKQLTDED